MTRVLRAKLTEDGGETVKGRWCVRIAGSDPSHWSARLR